MKFLHAADIHLDSPLHGLERYEGAPVSQMRAATRRSLERLVDLALREEVTFVLIAGDLYDGDWKDYNTGLFLTTQLARLREADIPVYIVSGNHDAASQLTKHLRAPGNVKFLSNRKPETVRLEDVGVVIHGQGFARREVPEDVSANYPAATAGAFNIGMLHTSATGRFGHDNYAPCTIDGLLAKNYDYWALGHIHTREVLHEHPFIIFPGNTQGRSVRETGSKGCTLVTVENGEVSQMEHRDTDVLRWSVCEVDAAGARDADSVIDRVRHGIGEELRRGGGLPLAVRVHVSGACEAHASLGATPERWVAEVRNAASDLGEVWIEKVKLRTSHQQDLASMLNRDDPLARLVRSIHELSARPELIEEFIGEFEELKRKLPAELRAGDGLLALGNAEQRLECVEGVRQLLLSRLLAMPEAR